VVKRSSTASIYPTFCLPIGAAASGPKFRVRPLASGETIPDPPGLSDDIEEQWLKGSWVLEYVKASDVDDGLVVRQTWLSEKPSDGETSWDGLFRVEHLLVSAALHDRADGSTDKPPARQLETMEACLSLTRRTLCTWPPNRTGWNNAGQWRSLDPRRLWSAGSECQRAWPDLKSFSW